MRAALAGGRAAVKADFGERREGCGAPLGGGGADGCSGLFRINWRFLILSLTQINAVLCVKEIRFTLK